VPAYVANLLLVCVVFECLSVTQGARVWQAAPSVYRCQGGDQPAGDTGLVRVELLNQSCLSVHGMWCCVRQ
jgi:hypothetical protein